MGTSGPARVPSSVTIMLTVAAEPELEEERPRRLAGLCRVCASDQEPLTHVFGQHGVLQNLQTKIQVCLRIVVQESDVLPTTVCGPCAARLDLSFELVQRCARGQQRLQRLLQDLIPSTRRSPGGEVLIDLGGVSELPCEEAPFQSSAPHAAEPRLSSPGRCRHLVEQQEARSPCSQPGEGGPLEARTSPSPQPVRCRHHSSSLSISSVEGGDCEMCGSLGVLADAVERMSGFEPSTTGSSSPSPASTVTSESPGPSGTSSSVRSTSAEPAGPSGALSVARSTSAEHVAGGRRRQTCEFCGKTFHHTGDLNKHRRCHTGERPYSCPQCGKRFAHVSNQLRHAKLHSGERPFVCSVCRRAFSRSDKLLRHNCVAPASS